MRLSTKNRELALLTTKPAAEALASALKEQGFKHAEAREVCTAQGWAWAVTLDQYRDRYVIAGRHAR